MGTNGNGVAERFVEALEELILRALPLPLTPTTARGFRGPPRRLTPQVTDRHVMMICVEIALEHGGHV